MSEISPEDQEGLEWILIYIEQIKVVMKKYGDRLLNFREEFHYRDGVWQSCLVIGRVMQNKLSDEFKEENVGFKWQAFIEKCYCLPNDFSIEKAMEIWEMIHKEIPELASYCHLILSQEERSK